METNGSGTAFFRVTESLGVSCAPRWKEMFGGIRWLGPLGEERGRPQTAGLRRLSAGEVRIISIRASA